MEVPLPPGSGSPQPAYTAQRAEFKLDFSLHVCPCAGYSLTNLACRSSWGSELDPGCLDSNPTFKYLNHVLLDEPLKLDVSISWCEMMPVIILSLCLGSSCDN